MLDVIVTLIGIRVKDLDRPICEKPNTVELKNLDDFRDSRGLYVSRRR